MWRQHSERCRPRLATVFAIVVAGGILVMRVGPAPPACIEDPASRCLARLGAELILSDGTVSRATPTIDYLVHLGEWELAEQLYVRALRRDGHADPEAGAAQWVAFARAQADMLTAIRAGQRVADAIASVPASGDAIEDRMLIRRAGWALLDGLSPADARNAGLPDATRENLRSLAAIVMDRGAGGNPAQRAGDAMDAATLLVLAGDREDALSLLRAVPPAPRFASVDRELFELLPAAEVMAALPVAYATGATLRRAAEAEPQHSRATVWLSGAFDAAVRDDPHPDLWQMTSIVGLAERSGHGELARALAERVVAVAATEPGYFPVYPSIYAARALRLAGGPAERIAALLDRAEAQLPRDDRAFGFSIHLGPVAWERSGLDTEARQQLAVERLHLGDVAAACRLLHPVGEVHGWDISRADVLSSGSVETYLDCAARALTRREQNELRAGLAMAALASDDAAMASWAEDSLRDLGRHSPRSGPDAVRLWAAIHALAVKTESPSLELSSRRKLAYAAWRARDGRSLTALAVTIADWR
jgi:hypothetical protein